MSIDFGGKIDYEPQRSTTTTCAGKDVAEGTCRERQRSSRLAHRLARQRSKQQGSGIRMASCLLVGGARVCLNKTARQLPR